MSLGKQGRELSKRFSKAVVIRAPGQSSIEDVAVPAMGTADVLIRVEYEGVCTTDLEIFDGRLGYYRDSLAKYPIVPGHEVSGHVVAVGDAVDSVAQGDAVVVECIQSCGECEWCRQRAYVQCASRTELGVIGRDGGYAEYVVAAARFVHRVPPGLDLRTACLCEPLAVVLKGLRRVEWARGFQPGVGSWAVVGAGPIGHLCAKVLAHRGHRVTAFDRDERRIAALVGASITTSQDLDQLNRFSMLVEATGDQDALEKTLLRSPAGAVVLLLGLPYERATFTFERIVGFDKIVVGSVGSSALEFDEALALLPALETAALTCRILPLDAFLEGWQLARERACLKVLMACRAGAFASE